MPAIDLIKLAPTPLFFLPEINIFQSIFVIAQYSCLFQKLLAFGLQAPSDIGALLSFAGCIVTPMKLIVNL